LAAIHPFPVCLLFSSSFRLEITSPISSLLYFGYMAAASWGFFLLTGSIGFVSTLLFVRKIFGAIKVD
jgi:transmembrane 9 superfamily member 2/4